MNKHAGYLIFSLLIFISATACKKESEKSPSLPKTHFSMDLLDGKQTGIQFVNAVEDQENFNILTYRNYYNGGGVAIGDINGDGLNDIYFTANMGPNKLYLNKGNFQFEDITEKAGVGGTKYWSTGVAMADVNADGLLDIYVCNSGDIENQSKENELFINNGDLTFTEKAKEYGLDDTGFSTHANFFDYDMDGDIDCFLLNNSYKDPERISFYSKERFKFGAPGGDRIFRNDNGKFTDVTEESGIFSSDIDFGLGISVGDLNNDGKPDMYISNDFWERDYLYLNQGQGKFKEDLLDNVSYVSVASMGSDIADLNNDGYMDIFSTDMLPSNNYRLKAALKFDEYFLEDLKWKNSYYHQYTQNCLQINQGDGTFNETGFFSGVAATDWSWGALIFDMDLDGKKDIFVSNGVYHDITDSDFIDFIGDENEVKSVVEEHGRYDFRDFKKYLPHNKQKNFFFLNKGNLKFDNVAASIGADQESFSNGAAYGDLDNDGDMDLVVNNVNMEAFVYQNKAVEESGNAHLKIKLKGNAGNPFGIGTIVKLFQPGQTQIYQSFQSRGFQSSVDPDIVFGLGQEKQIDSILVYWPDGKFQKLSGPQEGQSMMEISYDQGAAQEVLFPQAATIAGEVSASVLGGSVVHSENKYNDYDHERLIPHMLSTQGPKIVKGDVNGDGLEDFILLGAADQADQLFINKKGKWQFSPQKDFLLDVSSEGVCGALFDADGDGDEDLVIGVGGNEYQRGFPYFTGRFYTNDGKGNFSKEILHLPAFTGQVSCIRPYDFDGDGDLDLFIGGRSVPGNYGLVPRSFMLRNDGHGIWTDITDDVTGPIGMVTDAQWCDYNNDKIVDLIVVGEWMPVTIFSFEKGKFVKKQELPVSKGWWNCLIPADIDGDGDLDFIAGNWGENSKFQVSETRPMKMYVNDFDKNNKAEPIIEWYFQQDEKPYPFASKMDLSAQLPFIKKKAFKYQDYAKSQVGDLLDAESLAQSLQLTVNNLSTSILLNEGGNLVLRRMPDQAQWSPVFAAAVSDFDGDQIADIYLGGNFFRLKPEVGRHDSNKGGYFKGAGNGQFDYVLPKDSGFKIQGEVRDAQMIQNKLFIARNNDSVLVWDLKK